MAKNMNISVASKKNWENDAYRNSIIESSIRNWKNGKYDNVDWKLSGSKGSKNKYNKDPKNIYELSTRTITKILKRMTDDKNIGCCICGWNESTCDIHHIRGRKINNPNHHSNLTLVCPNHHRLLHNKVINENDVISFEEHIGDLWKNYYYG